MLHDGDFSEQDHLHARIAAECSKGKNRRLQEPVRWDRMARSMYIAKGDIS